MEKLEKMDESQYTSFMRVLFGLSSPTPVPSDPESDPAVGKIEWLDPTLNDSQKDAIRFALASREISLIHGPPGVSCLQSFSLPFSHSHSHPPTHSHTLSLFPSSSSLIKLN